MSGEDFVSGIFCGLAIAVIFVCFGWMKIEPSNPEATK